MSAFQLAQLNVSKLLEPLDSPRLAEFVANIGRINALAEDAPGFVWRLQGDGGDATGFRPYGDDYVVNLTVWQDVDSLHAYAYHSAHADMFRRRNEWFKRSPVPTVAMWWVPAGHIPTMVEARAKLELLRAQGPSAESFTFKLRYPAPV
jgi:hypothetical protein